MAGELLRVENLTVTFECGKVAIKNLCLTVNSGEMLAIVGQSGGGKSLLALSILDLLPKSAKMVGEIYYKNERITSENISELRGEKIALVPQNVSFLDPLLPLKTQVIGVNGEKSRQKELFKKYSLCDRSEGMLPRQLSGGMARRGLICAVMMKDPDVIIADEPTPGLDLAIARRTFLHFDELANSGKGVVIITHDLTLAYTFCSRLLIMKEGEIVESIASADFLSGSKIAHPYTRALFEALPQNGFKGARI